MKGLEREGHASRDEDLDEGVEDEIEKETEPGVGQVEYVSDVEGESDDMEDFEDWLDEGDAGEAQDDSEEWQSASGSGASEDEGDDAGKAPEKVPAYLKRKRSTVPSKPKKKAARDPKGPRVEIEYEVEREPPARQLLRS